MRPHGSRSLPQVDLGGKLIAVSNRVSRPSKNAAPGGLALALSESLKARGGTWVGWSGDLVADGAPADVETETANDVTYALLDIEESAFHGYYEGYANGLIWPAFHGRADLSVHRAASFDDYCAVNRAFAETTARLARPDDTIWVHDYHFLMLAEELRNAGVSNTVGLFLHIPFPHVQVFRTIPEAEALARALFAYDTIGVQTARDAQNLAESLAALGEGAMVESGTGFEARAFGSSVQITPIPIGIDVAALQAELNRPAPAEVARYMATLSGRRSLLGVDRLDYSKGLPQKLEAFYHYLAADPCRADKTVLTQIAPVSRGSVEAYAETREAVETLAGRISGRFSSLSGSPLRFLTRAFSRRSVAHLMAAADVGLVTPLADGMNLVAKEFVAAQDPKDPGVLVLSEFAGAAEEMDEALLVNPHDAEGMAETYAQALSMPLAERRERHEALMDVVRDTDIARWTSRCIDDLASAAR